MAKHIPVNVRLKIEDQVVKLKQRCKELDIPEPKFYSTVWGYKKLICTTCSIDCKVSGYLEHYRKKHQKKTFKSTHKADKKIDYPNLSGVVVFRDGSRFDMDAWKIRAEESRRSIMERYGNGVTAKENS